MNSLQFFSHFARFPAFAVAGVLLGSTSYANEISVPDYGELNGVMDFDPAESTPHLETPRVFDSYFEWKDDFVTENRFPYLVEYGLISQWGSHGDDRFHADHELNISGLWTLTDSPDLGQGTLIGWLQNAATLGGVTTSELMENLGVLSPLNGGDTFPGKNATRIAHLAWEQRLPDSQSRIMVGKLSTRILLNQNRYTVSDREDFFSPMLVNNVVVPFTARLGLGVFGEIKRETWYLSGMIRDADATSDWLDFDSLSTGNWEYATEAAWTPTIDGIGEGRYRFTYHYTDAVGTGASTLPSGWSFSTSMDQDIGETLGVYFRFAYADSPFRTFRQRTAAGAQIKSPLGFPDDRIGFGWWRGNPTDGALRSENGFEVFWKLRLTPNLELTPDIQLILDPALAPNRSSVVVGGLRMRLEF